MEAAPNFQKTGQPAVDLYFAGCRLRNSRKDFQKGRFARSVLADYGQSLPLIDVERHISQCPEFSFRRMTRILSSSAKQKRYSVLCPSSPFFEKGSPFAFAEVETFGMIM